MSERRRKIHQRACPLHFKRVKDNQLSRWAASGWQRGDKGYKYGSNRGWKVQSRCLPWGESSPGKGQQMRKASCIEGYPGENPPLGRSSPGKGRQMRKLLPAYSLGRIVPGEILSRQGSANAKAASCIEGFPGENRPRGDPLQARVGKCESCFLHRGFPWGESSPRNAKAASCNRDFVPTKNPPQVKAHHHLSRRDIPS